MFRSRHAGRSLRAASGFTLIEVLVVVAIIALLVSILIPSLAAARRQARIVVCATNLKTIGTGTMYYAQANQDSAPAGYGWDTKKDVVKADEISGNPWEFLYPMVQKVSVKSGVAMQTSDSKWHLRLPTYTCPDDKAQHYTDQRQIPTPEGLKPGSVWLSYGANLIWIYAKYNDVKAGPGKLSKIKKASTIVSYHDGGDDGGNGKRGWILVDCRTFGSENNNLYNQCEFELRHQLGNNFAYLDTHVDFAKYDKTSSPQYGLPPWPWAFVPGAGPTYLKDNGYTLGHTVPHDAAWAKDNCRSGGC